MKEEIENLSEPDERMSRMLAGLKQVEAPKDFEFRLKARIANASPSAYRTRRYKKRFAFALPATAFAMISAFVYFNGNFSASDQPPTQASMGNATEMTIPVQETQNPPDNSLAAAADNLNTAPPADVRPMDLNTASSVWNERKPQPTFISYRQTGGRRIPGRKNLLVKETTQSTDQTQQVATVITPPDFSTLPKKAPTEITGLQKGFSVEKDVLLPLGIETVSENGNLKVKSIKQNSPAERMGVKTDDLIETLDGRKVSSSPLHDGKTIQVKKLGVKRGAEQIEIILQTNQR